jgi:hypothetical protein
MGPPVPAIGRCLPSPEGAGAASHRDALELPVPHHPPTPVPREGGGKAAWVEMGRLCRRSGAYLPSISG